MFTPASLDRSLISFDLNSFSIESYDLDLRGLSMTPISIQNALQDNYPVTEDRYIAKVESRRDNTSVQNTDSPLQHLEDQTMVQEPNLSLHHSDDQTTAQSIDLVIHPSEDQTTIQYADSAIYSPADQTIVQSLAPISEDLEDQTTCQQEKSYMQQAAFPPVAFQKSVQGQTVQHHIVQEKEPFFARFAHFKEQLLCTIRKTTNFKQRQSNPMGQLADAGTLKPQSFLPGQINHPVRDRMQAEVQPSPEEYRKVLQELDHCRLSFAKELARNSKLRDAIAQANKISQTSRWFRDAQTLLRSWKQI
jgi:hypothetical protein